MAESEDNCVPDILEARGDEFFQLIEKLLKTSLPQYVIKILKMNGFDSAFMMSKLVESKISAIEEFMRDEFASYMIPDGENVNDYLGVYKQCQNKFKFLCGHKTLLEIMRDTCKVYYPSITQKKAANDSVIDDDIDENSKNEIFQKLFDGITTWLNSQGKFKQVLQFQLDFIINCVTNNKNSDEISYTVKCPVPSCSIDQTYSVIWKAYVRSKKNKKGDEAEAEAEACHLDTPPSDSSLTNHPPINNANNANNPPTNDADYTPINNANNPPTNNTDNPPNNTSNNQPINNVNNTETNNADNPPTNNTDNPPTNHANNTDEPPSPLDSEPNSNIEIPIATKDLSLCERECSSTKVMSSKPTSIESVISCGTTSCITETLTCQSSDDRIDDVPFFQAPIISKNRLHDPLSEQISDLSLGVKSKVSRVRKIRDAPTKSNKSGSSVPAKRLRK